MSLWAKNQQKLKAAVTGGAGFIGSHLVDRLLSDGLEVIALDNLATGRMENLSAARAFETFRFYEADINDPGALACLQGVDWLFNLAGLADIVPSIAQPLCYHRANVDGTIRVLEQARQSGVKRFVYAAGSSAHVPVGPRLYTPKK
jgi:UDP-glucose 4-epimerase